MMAEKKDSEVSLLAMVLVFFGVLAIGFLARSVLFLFFLVLSVALIIGFVFYLIKYFQEKKRFDGVDQKMEKTIQQNLKLCEEQILRNEGEMKEIELNISELENRLKSKIPINKSTMQDSRKLIKGFDRELQLREAKLEFYHTCREKLETIQYNQKLNREIALKNEKLKQLQEDHFEDLAEMEQLRSNMTYDKTYIDTINELSIRMAESTSLDTAQILHEELKMITKELRDL